MADDDLRRGPGQREAGGDPATPDTVALPEHASAYFSPRSPPVSTAHPTLETEAIRLDPAIDPDNAVTQPLNIERLSPPAWLGERLQSDAPTVLVPVVRARRRRQRRLFVAIAAAAVGVVAGILYGVTRPISPRQTAASAALPVPSGAAPRVERPAVPEPVPASTADRQLPEPARSEASTSPAKEIKQPAVHPAPIRTPTPAGERVRPVASAPSSWLKSEPPKAWFN